jgi:hypothetical protein
MSAKNKISLKKDLNKVYKSIDAYIENRLLKDLAIAKTDDENNAKILEADDKNKISKKKGKGKGKSTVKKTPTGYLLYSKDERPKVKEEYPDMKTTEVMKELGARWKAETQKVKDKYNKQAKEAKETKNSQ